MSFFIFTISYLMSYFGFLLGKATEEEHKELVKPLYYSVEILTVLTYGLVFYFFSDKLLVWILFIILLIFRIYYHKNELFVIIHNLILFAFTFVFFNKYFFEGIYLILIPFLILLFNKSMDKFHFKKEMYMLFLVLAIYIVFSI